MNALKNGWWTRALIYRPADQLSDRPTNFQRMEIYLIYTFIAVVLLSFAVYMHSCMHAFPSFLYFFPIHGITNSLSNYRKVLLKATSKQRYRYFLWSRIRINQAHLMDGFLEAARLIRRSYDPLRTHYNTSGPSGAVHLRDYLTYTSPMIIDVIVQSKVIILCEAVSPPLEKYAPF